MDFLDHRTLRVCASVLRMTARILYSCQMVRCIHIKVCVVDNSNAALLDVQIVSPRTRPSDLDVWLQLTISIYRLLFHAAL